MAPITTAIFSFKNLEMGRCREQKPLCSQMSPGEARKLNPQLTSSLDEGHSCSSWHARNDGVLQPGDPSLSDETGSALISQNLGFYLNSYPGPFP